MHPTVQVAPDQIFVRDGNVWTSAGVTAGIDLALALVARDHGRDVAADAARWLVVFLQRPGGQAQFSVPLAIAGLDTDVLAELQTWMVEHPDADLSVAALARRCHLSPRTFHRLVGRETGMTPGTWVEQIRVEAARRMLESTDLPVPAIARACGFGTVSTLYRAFERRLGVAPATYRHHFRAVPSPERSAS
jgi:transcriptional regulator GlxA family with amidase domain